MQDELDTLLCERYPKIFADRRNSAQTSAMGRGFECGDGWFSLIEALCERLQFQTDHNNAPQIIATQVKEKFGSLRFYARNMNVEQAEMIAMAEAMSENSLKFVEIQFRNSCDDGSSPKATFQAAAWTMRSYAKRNIRRISPMFDEPNLPI